MQCLTPHDQLDNTDTVSTHIFNPLAVIRVQALATEISQHLIRMTKWNPQTRIIYISGVVLQSTKDRQLITQLCKNQNQGHQQRLTSDSEFAPIMSKSSIISSSEDSVIRRRKAYYHNRFVTDSEFKTETNCHHYLTLMGQPPRSQSRGVG